MTPDQTESGTSASKNVSAATGHTYWVIPDGYIPPESRGTLESHESICVLNTSATDAELHITIYFEDREPLEGMVAEVPARRTKHIRTASLRSGSSLFHRACLMRLRFRAISLLSSSTVVWTRPSLNWL